MEGGGHQWIFPKIFLGGGPKLVKFVFSHSKLRKQPSYVIIFKIGGPLPLLHSDARGCTSDRNICVVPRTASDTP